MILLEEIVIEMFSFVCVCVCDTWVIQKHTILYVSNISRANRICLFGVFQGIERSIVEQFLDCKPFCKLNEEKNIKRTEQKIRRHFIMWIQLKSLNLKKQKTKYPTH